MSASHESRFISSSPKRQPSKAVRQSVRDAFDAEALTRLCTTWDFTPYAKRVNLSPGRDGRERFYWHQDNGSDILAIAHLDTVQADMTCQVVDTASGLLAVSGALDDRLGVYIILEMLPKLGITCDWLLTTDEEIAQSTAECFDPPKEYNWMIQFDRGGTDVVMYQYETPELCELVEASGAQVGVGSFSDICLLDHLGCAGFNWGVGYEDYHSARSHAWLEDTFRMVARFVKFHKANATSVFLACDPDTGHLPKDDDDFDIADCGHAIDWNDPTSYVGIQGSSYIMCGDCATPEPPGEDF